MTGKKQQEEERPEGQRGWIFRNWDFSSKKILLLFPLPVESTSHPFLPSSAHDTRVAAFEAHPKPWRPWRPGGFLFWRYCAAAPEGMSFWLGRGARSNALLRRSM